MGSTDRVPIGEARQLVERLRSLNRDVWAVFVGDEGHRFDKRTNADYIRAVEVMFLRRHLGLAATRRQKD